MEYKVFHKFHKFLGFHKSKAAEGTNYSQAHTHVKDYGLFSVDNGPYLGARVQTSEDLNKTMATFFNMVLTNTIVPTISEGPNGSGSQDGGLSGSCTDPRLGTEGVRGSLTPRSWQKGGQVSGSKGSRNHQEAAGQTSHVMQGPSPVCVQHWDISLLLTCHLHHQLHKGYLGKRQIPHQMYIIL